MNGKARTSQFGFTIRRGLIGLTLVCATGAVLNNVLSYRLVLQQRAHQAEDLAASLAAGGEHDENTDAALRYNFYSLLKTLGKDPALHHGDSGVFVADAAFFDGAYIDKPSDTVLERCAIQPFSIPALTGMPLVSALRIRQNGCKYDSYAYQYLSAHEPIDATILSRPCALARLRGMRNVVVINRIDTSFTASRLDCANH
ncbi:hypothetical protein PPGU19_026690 [Paraburkholderia sp. PGU19]|uniref:hypothetical protein n=1 Tax=Paraburkholderia sp. PGU19 TaxID=2735434 RepID=UPI0015DA8DEC|nr:hypothetical protein [Paraburkholderia sp. PGU19]BCF98100.1 hypothetical protein PPGU19_026690 [Paraburkholderia sp. PGU19]